MSRCKAIFITIVVPTFIALAVMKLSEKQKIQLSSFSFSHLLLESFSQLLNTVKSLFSGIWKSSTRDEINAADTKQQIEAAAVKDREKRDISKKEIETGKTMVEQDTKKPVAPHTKPNTVSKVQDKAVKSNVDDKKPTLPVKKTVQPSVPPSTVKVVSGVKTASVQANANKENTQKILVKSPTPPQKPTPKPNNQQKEDSLAESTHQDFVKEKTEFKSKETREVANFLNSFVSELEKKINNHSITLKDNNDIITAVKEIQDLNDSLPKGSKCSLIKEEEDTLKRCEQESEIAVELCTSKNKMTSSKGNSLKNIITESLQKLRALDTNLRLNLEHCPQPPSNFCIQSKKKILKAVEEFTSNGEKNKLQILMEDSFSEAKSNIDLCVRNHTIKIKIDLKKVYNTLSKCYVTKKR